MVGPIRKVLRACLRSLNTKHYALFAATSVRHTGQRGRGHWLLGSFFCSSNDACAHFKAHSGCMTCVQERIVTRDPETWSSMQTGQEAFASALTRAPSLNRTASQQVSAPSTPSSIATRLSLPPRRESKSSAETNEKSFRPRIRSATRSKSPRGRLRLLVSLGARLSADHRPPNTLSIATSNLAAKKAVVSFAFLILEVARHVLVKASWLCSTEK